MSKIYKYELSEGASATVQSIDVETTYDHEPAVAFSGFKDYYCIICNRPLKRRAGRNTPWKHVDTEQGA